MTNPLAELLLERDYLLADGATGTNMMGMGLPAGRAPDLWNLERPDQVTRLHESFLEVGSDIILTNTFGANRRRLVLDHAQDRTREINEAGAEIARTAGDATGRRVIVAGSMGPSGEMMEPHGKLNHELALEIFSEQAEALLRGGVDVLWIETIFDFDELAAAIAAASGTGLPVASTMTFDTGGRTMMGNSPEEAADFIRSLSPGVIAYGANCGVGPSMLLDSLLRLGRGGAEGDLIIAKSNCGVPRTVDGKVVYDGDEDTMARYARLARDAGARIIGGCCGTTPKHLAAIATSLEGYIPGSPPDDAVIEAALGKIVRSKGRAVRRRGRRG
jgi:5-methyltetrahydrofolate--homocysteine methyltransferase